MQQAVSNDLILSVVVCKKVNWSKTVTGTLLDSGMRVILSPSFWVWCSRTFHFNFENLGHRRCNACATGGWCHQTTCTRWYHLDH